ncbi:hypothetical protein Bca4012_052884 [Brassica carinata]|uniref:(rape) hypothetical protein n=1 Tax=Brassica napus TaxID=3708 RepID=A0A816KK64_BRANA|nr:unnamed protein product [Brassica napus]
MALRALSRAVPFVFGGDRRLKYRKIGWCRLVSSGVLEVCEGFVMSLEVVSVVLVKVPTESGGVVLIPACSGEISGHFSFSSTAISRLGHDR